MKQLLPVFLVLSVLRISAQNSSTPNAAQRAGEAIFFEKTGLTPADLQQMAADPSHAKQIAIQKRRAAHDDDRNGNPSAASSNEVIVSGSSDIESEIHAAMNPNDSSKLVCSPNTQNANGLSNPIYFSGDFGQTWAGASFNDAPHIPGGFTLGGGDPMFAFDSNDTAYYSWIRLFFGTTRVYAAMYWAYSTDNGATWQRAANDRIAIDSSATAFGFPDKFFDKQWMAVDRSPSSPYQHDLYCALFQTQTSTNGQNIVVYKKPRGSNQFNASPGIVSDNSFTSVQFTDIVVDNNGYVHVSFFGSKDSVNYAVWHSVSTDGGMTFSTPVKISDAHVPGFSGDQPNANIVGIDPTRFYPCQHLACDNSSGPNANNLYATWTANGTTSAATAGLDIYFSRSTDGGATWSSPVIINNDTATAADNFYSAITMNGNGVVLLSWYDRRTDPVNNKTTHYYFAYSSDGGQTFQGNQQITNTPTDFSTIGAQNNGFGIGEYTQIVATGAYAIPVWTDGRTNDGDCNIYCATIQWATFSGVAEPVAVNNHHISSVYPNPSSGSLSITLDFGTAQNANVTITDLSGRTVMNVCDGKTFEGKSRMDIDVSALAAGNYLLVLRTENGKETSKFTVAR